MERGLLLFDWVLREVSIHCQLSGGSDGGAAGHHGGEGKAYAPILYQGVGIHQKEINEGTNALQICKRSIDKKEV